MVKESALKGHLVGEKLPVSELQKSDLVNNVACARVKSEVYRRVLPAIEAANG